MKRSCLILLTLIAGVGTPATAQWPGLPAWNSPKGGGGITVSADYGRVDFDDDTDPLEATAWGARGSLGLGKATLAVGVSSFNPRGTDPTTTVYGAQGAYRLIGGSLLPVAVNLQAGVSRHDAIDRGTEDITNWLLGAGISTTLPTPGVSLEPYLSVSNRWHRVSGQSQSRDNVGFVVGANVGFTRFGLHFAYDSEKFDGGGRWGVFGLGAHVALRAPVGS